jgi:hypothetical protein
MVKLVHVDWRHRQVIERDDMAAARASNAAPGRRNMADVEALRSRLPTWP